MAAHQIKIGVIGGSGLYGIPGFTKIEELDIETPWGTPSDKILICVDEVGHKVAFLARHGTGHTLNPSEIPVRANIAALKSIGVEVILAFSAVGSLREEIEPGHFVLPNQILDRTKGFRENTFFEKGIAAHAGFADPFNAELAKLILKVEQKVDNLKIHKDKTLVCIEGPSFSTRAESHLYRSWGADIINMSVVPEAKLAREAEIAYQMICMSTDYDCWRVSEEAVTVQAVMATMSKNAENAKFLLSAILPELVKELEGENETKVLENVKGGMEFAVVTSKVKQNEEAKTRLNFLFKGRF